MSGLYERIHPEATAPSRLCGDCGRPTGSASVGFCTDCLEELNRKYRAQTTSPFVQAALDRRLPAKAIA